jgi:hypothetical protein
MPSQIFISGLILGFLLGVLVCYVGLQIISQRRYLGHKRDIDRLTDDFQQLFRQIDEENKGS